MSNRQHVEKSVLVFLSLLSGGLLGFAFPPNQFGVIACFGLIPLLLIYEYTEGISRPLKYTYLTFVFVHVFAVYWMGGFVHASHGLQMLGGILLILVNPLFFIIPAAGYLIIRRTFSLTPALIALPFIWVGFEYIRSVGELAFPWITLGNTHTYDIARIQFITYTGVYGLSFLILILNILTFAAVRNISIKRWKLSSLSVFGVGLGVVLIYLIPLLYGNLQLAKIHEDQKFLNVGLVQPHVDPFDKWDMSRLEHITQLLRQSENIISESPDIIVWPETSVPFYLFMEVNRVYYEIIREFVEAREIPILIGLPYAVMNTGDDPTVTGERKYRTYNAAILLVPSLDGYQWYGKIVLVPFVERIPYGDIFNFAVKIRERIGTGGWDIGPDKTIFEMSAVQNVKFGTVICYESVYPGFVRHFPKLGADFLLVITNDSWWDRFDEKFWGRTPGPRQHAQMSVLRAVENRRSVARAANGGISSFIDPYGRTIGETAFFKRTEKVVEIPLSDELTFYSKHGDMFAKLCLLIGSLPIMASLGERMRKRLFAIQNKYGIPDETDRSKE